jgi:hypothetical protein
MMESTSTHQAVQAVAPGRLEHAKSMLISPPDVAIDHLFPPYTSEKNADLKQWFGY